MRWMLFALNFTMAVCAVAAAVAVVPTDNWPLQALTSFVCGWTIVDTFSGMRKALGGD